MTVYAAYRTGQCWDDLPPIPVVGARLGSTAPTLATFITDIEQYTFDATNDYIIGATEFVHSYKEGTVFEPHVHWTTNGSDINDRYVNFQIKYSILIAGSAAAAQVTITTGDLTIPAATADRTYYVSTFGDRSGVGINIGDYLVFRFERIAAVGTAPSNDPFVIAVGFHALRDSTGSLLKYAK